MVGCVGNQVLGIDQPNIIDVKETIFVSYIALWLENLIKNNEFER